LQEYRALQDIIAILGHGRADRRAAPLTVARARKIQRFFKPALPTSPRFFTGTPGVLVSVEDTVRGFKGIVNGDYDHLPEAAFYMVGTIDDAIAQGEEARRSRLTAKQHRSRGHPWPRNSP